MEIENLAVKELVFEYEEDQKKNLIPNEFPNIFNFDLIGPDVSLANAFRRILLSEVCL